MKKNFSFLVLLISLLYSGDSIGEFQQFSSQEGSNCTFCHQMGQALETDKGKPECQSCHGFSLPVSNGHKKEIPMKKKSRKKLSSTPIAGGMESMVHQESVYIPEGEFLMGNAGRESSEGEGNVDEQPLHRVYLKGFWMDRYEVTNGMYQVFVKATGHRIPRHWEGGTHPQEKMNHPVVYVDWYESKAYCQWAGKRLPTEEEWEKAARGTGGRTFPWGNRFDISKANTPQSWLSKGQKGGTAPVGSYEEGRSPYGLYDMAGNVYEWTSSWYRPYPGNQVLNMHYGKVNKVLRGGSWYDCLSYGCGLSSPSYNRTRFIPKIRNKGFGFRCARSGSPSDN